LISTGAAKADAATKVTQNNPITIANNTFFLSMFLPPFLVLTLHLKQHLDNTSLMKRLDPDGPPAEIPKAIIQRVPFSKITSFNLGR
jgi:hypothetical protein